MKTFLNSDWLRAVQFVRTLVPKNESANFIDYKIQPFLAENNTKTQTFTNDKNG